MLLNTEKQAILGVIGYCCTFGLLPAKVKLTKSELVPRSSWKYSLSYLLFVINAIYKIGSLARTLFLEDGAPLHQMVLHVMMAVAGPLYGHWYYIMFIQCPGYFRTYFKMTMTGNTEVSGKEKKRSWSRRLQECTLHDLYVLGLPYLVLAAVASIILVYACYPSMSILMYGSIPKEYKSWALCGLLLLEDSRCVVVNTCIGILIWTIQVMSFELVSHQLQQLIKSMQRTADERRLMRAYKSLRHIQLYVGISNMVNSFAIFSCKIGFISICSIAGYVAIAHFNDYPLFGVLNYMVLLNGLFIYTFAYGKAYQVPLHFERAAQIAVLRVCRNGRTKDSEVFKRQIRSFPRVGVKVGEFHMMERLSTIIFIDYVVGNIVSMLVAYG